MNAIPLINNIPKTNINNEKQLRQEINTSLVALKKEAGTLEGLINEAAQMLVTINNRIATLENDTVKKSDIVDVVQSGNLQPVTSNAVADKISSLDVSSVGGSGKYISAISETDGVISATATDLGNMVPVNSVTSGNLHSVTSNAVNNAIAQQRFLIPLCTTFQTTTNTNWRTYKQLGSYFIEFFNNLPIISGKTKKVRLLFDVYTLNNSITVGLKRRDDTDYTIILDRQVVWGGLEVPNFSSLFTVVIDSSFLSAYSIIGFKTSNGSQPVGIGFAFAEVYYE